MSTFAERLSEVIADSKLTKTKFAEAVGISQPFLSQICSGVTERDEDANCLLFEVFHFLSLLCRYYHQYHGIARINNEKTALKKRRTLTMHTGLRRRT